MSARERKRRVGASQINGELISSDQRGAIYMISSAACSIE